MGPYDIQAQLQDKMQELVGIARSQESLTQALAEVQNLREKAENVHSIGNREYNAGWHTALDLDCLLTVSEAIALAALERRASIGAHSRDDHPEKEESGAGKYNTIIKKSDDGAMAIRREPIDELRADLQEIIDEMGIESTNSCSRSRKTLHFPLNYFFSLRELEKKRAYEPLQLLRFMPITLDTQCYAGVTF